MSRPPTFSTQELKERGWTAAMIRDLLGPHDRERPNELRVGRRNRTVDAPVKLYLQARVITAESTERYARAEERARTAQDAAQKGAEARKARIEAEIDAYIASYTPTPVRPDGWQTLSEQQRWDLLHNTDDHWRFSHEPPPRLSRTQRHRIWAALHQKDHDAFAALYPEP